MQGLRHVDREQSAVSAAVNSSENQSQFDERLICYQVGLFVTFGYQMIINLYYRQRK